MGNINNNSSKVRQDYNNKINHIQNGNIMKKGTFTLVTWNKGNGTFKNKRDDILLTIDRYRPDIFAIHEANFDLNSDRGFDNYVIEANTLCKGHQISRTIMLIKQGIPYKRRKDLENDYIASIWVQIKINSKVSTLISSFYRQWSLPQELKINNSNSPASQKDRYSIFTNQISRASKEGRDIVILTDENIDSLQDKSSTGYCKNIQLKTLCDNSIIENSLTYHNNKATFCRKWVKSCIDYIISNCPLKIMNVRTHDGETEVFGYKDWEFNNIMSDHFILSCTYNHKKINLPQQFMITRNSKLLTRYNLNQYFSNNEV